MLRAGWRIVATLALVAVPACAGSGPTSPCQPVPVDMACLAGPPSFIATVTRITHEQGMSPAGPLDQYALWLAIPPSQAANAGVVVAARVPVFLQVGTRMQSPSSIRDVRVGDRLGAWVSPNTGYGAVEGPPGAPVYFGQKLLIQR